MAMFSDRTYDAIKREMLAMAPEGVDTRQGSIYYDAIAACALKLANFYVDADTILEMVFVWSATGEYLDRKGREYGLARNAATQARYAYSYAGTVPAVGTRFFSDGLYFTLQKDDGGALYLLAETAGEEANNVLEGTPATPVNSIIGLSASLFGERIGAGANQETDEKYRTRIQEKIAGPAQNGNKQHYKTWCEENDSVGRARILPLWNGENTVKAVLFGTDGRPLDEVYVAQVQEYVDPGGTGTGEGAANIGAHFTAVAATEVPVSVSCAVTLAKGCTLDEARAEAEEAFREYLKDLMLNTAEGTAPVVRISSLGVILYGLDAVIDYADLQINGRTSNLQIADTECATLRGVTVVEAL